MAARRLRRPAGVRKSPGRAARVGRQSRQRGRSSLPRSTPPWSPSWRLRVRRSSGFGGFWRPLGLLILDHRRALTRLSMWKRPQRACKMSRSSRVRRVMCQLMARGT